MKNKILKLFKTETVAYLFYGVLTTIVSYLSFYLASLVLSYDYILIINTVSFVCAVVFAYITNKLYVFKSKSWKWQVLKVEIPSFLSARILSYFLEQFGLYLSVNVLHLDLCFVFGINCVYIAKIVLSFVVVILNWVISKFFVFKIDRR